MNMDDVIPVVQDFGFDVVKLESGNFIATEKEGAQLLLSPHEYGVDVLTTMDLHHVLATGRAEVLQFLSGLNAQSTVVKYYLCDGGIYFEATVPWHGTTALARIIMQSFLAEIFNPEDPGVGEAMRHLRELDAGLAAEALQHPPDNRRRPRSYCKCDGCKTTIKYGNPVFHIDRTIGQIDWEDGVSMETVIENDALLNLCAACGNKFALEKLESMLKEVNTWSSPKQ